MDHPDVSHFNSKKANTSRLDVEPVPEENVIHQSQATVDDDYYDMSKKKYMYIFNHYKYKQTSEYGNKRPKERIGTHFDVKILDETFSLLGFDVKTHQDLSRNKIIKAIEKLIKQDHSNTSCIAIAILTHGSNDGVLFAEDQPYELKEITKLLETQKLVLIPKLLFIQVSVVNIQPLQPRVEKVIRRMNSLRSSIRRLGRSITPQVSKCWAQIRSSESSALTTTDAAPINSSPINACRGQALDKGHQVEVDGCTRNLVHVPSHIDFLILHSAADDHASFRTNEEGSWMIQKLCKVLMEYHLTYDILQIITIVNKRVAYECTAFNSQYPSYNKKKQSLEARYTLTKFLKL
ncbi:caspase-3-like isoform X2 [Plodia interpunctella]|uniref:caspase-3-like isoform X2 n=1 Tax=Plodia interpunctella TaxID=58824 RepID=UPI002367B300|nr:caspase-3-like isoform X2 [Plodia interpunctella]